MAKIHPSSIVMDGAILGADVEIGPLCYVGPNVKLGNGTRLISHCNVDGYTTLGENNILHPFAAFFTWISSGFTRLFAGEAQPSITEDELLEHLKPYLHACAKALLGKTE